jgi:proteasome lid subunit RPN8/RPN11
VSKIDVRDLTLDELPTGQFPSSLKADFRVFMAPEVHRGTWEHAKKNLTVEICGVLVGNWKRDENGPYALATNFIPCENASSKFAEVTFTHESWALINREMDTRFADQRIVGWYHSHPDFGIFLSDRDCFIQEHFFSAPGQIAYVIDPVRLLEGVFAWRAGKPTPLEHYWVGDVIRTIDASHSAAGDKPRRGAGDLNAESLAAPPPSRRQSSLDLAATILSWLALFLLGYLVAGLQSRWEREMIVEGTVAHYGFNKLVKIGLEENLANVRSELSSLAEALDQLPDSTAELSEEQRETVAKQRASISSYLGACERALGRIQEIYGLSDEERMTLLRLVAQKQAELRKLSEAAAAAETSDSTPATQTEDKKSDDAQPSAAGDPKPSTESESTPTDPR